MDSSWKSRRVLHPQPEYLVIRLHQSRRNLKKGRLRHEAVKGSTGSEQAAGLAYSMIGVLLSSLHVVMAGLVPRLSGSDRLDMVHGVDSSA
ncbi:hypothetical protein, partial [Bradyrhizobium sp. SZCCHNS3002]|uniref:hypothetical protein n=1 Tax=Bradyrhizobium sp. SZCCHNS3002 TaxID=3057310 RepID=UPI0028E9812A